jgi:hypothetical protein
MEEKYKIFNNFEEGEELNFSWDRGNGIQSTTVIYYGFGRDHEPILYDPKSKVALSLSSINPIFFEAKKVGELEELSVYNE